MLTYAISTVAPHRPHIVTTCAPYRVCHTLLYSANAVGCPSTTIIITTVRTLCVRVFVATVRVRRVVFSPDLSRCLPTRAIIITWYAGTDACRSPIDYDTHSRSESSIRLWRYTRRGVAVEPVAVQYLWAR